MTTVDEAAEKYQSDWHHHRFAYSKDYTPKSAFLAGAEWMRQQFTLHGTTDCSLCEDGRATLYSTLKGICIECCHRMERDVDPSLTSDSDPLP